MRGSKAAGFLLKTCLALCALLTGLVPWVAAYAQTTTTYSNTATGNINSTTACTSSLVRNFTVASNYTIADVDLGVLATHTWRGDIQLILQSPQGTRVRLVNGDINNLSGDNFNVRLNDDGTQTVNTDGNTATHSTSAPPYQHNFRPNSPLSAFNGQNAQGIWRLEICDLYPSADNGSFRRADLYITSQPSIFADLSLTKAVNNASPTTGTNVTYTLTLTNAVLSTAATNVTVSDSLPIGAAFVSSSGYGSYSPATGIWTVPSIAAGQSRAISIVARVNATSGASVVNIAEVATSPIFDPDSTPGNGATGEDDYATASFTVSGTPSAGTPPAFSCPAGSTIFDWDTQAWTAGSLSNSYALANIGTVDYNISGPLGMWLNDATFGGQTPAKSTYYTAGVYSGQQALHYLVDFVSAGDKATTTIALGNGAAGMRFIVSDVDDGAAQFLDQLTVTGTYKGASSPVILTNGSANYVAGNTAIGLSAVANNSQAGNVVVTFQNPVDTITIVYGASMDGPASPGQQGIGIHDLTFCNQATANIEVSKTSVVYDSGANPLYRIPGNDVTYSIAVSNSASGSLTANSVFVVDALPANVTFFNGDANGAAAGTDPVLFSNNGSGLTWTAANDVRYSNGKGPPVSYAQCSYTPASGYDENVRYICFNPKGIMAGKTGSAAPAFTLSFRALIR